MTASRKRKRVVKLGWFHTCDELPRDFEVRRWRNDISCDKGITVACEVHYALPTEPPKRKARR